MEAKAFRDWLAHLTELNTDQRSMLEARLAGEPNVVVAELEHLGGTAPRCPHCACERGYRWGKTAQLQRYRCRACGKTYNVLTGTALARLRLKEKWAKYAEALIQGLTVRNAAASCGISKNTSFRWRHRFLRAPAGQKPARLAGIVEVDETYFLESFKGQRHVSRPVRKRGGHGAKRGLSPEQIPVLIARDRHGATTDEQLSRANAAEITTLLKPLLPSDTILCTDGAAAYRTAARALKLGHRALNLAAGVRILAGVYHIQNVNAYDSRLKGWMARFHGVATKYLVNYLGWRRLLEHWGPACTPKLCLAAAMNRISAFQQLMQT